MDSVFGLDVYVRPSRNEGFLGRCLGIDAYQEEILASVAFEADQAPLLQLGQETELEFRADALEGGVHTKALTILRIDETAQRRYCFQGRLSKRVLMHLMDRRRAPRTRVPPARSVALTVLDLGDPAPEAILHDISATGFSVALEPRHERLLFYRTEMRVLFRAPGESAAIEVRAAIRHRRLAGTRLLYGLEVEGQITEFKRAQEDFLLHLASLRSPTGDAG